jgi:hypothetical protein
MINFRLAACFGRVWLRVRKGQASAKGQMPDECMMVARGEPIAAMRLLAAENFAANMWWGAGMALCSLFVIAPVSALAIPGHVGRDIAVWSIGISGTLVMLVMSQMAFLRIQSYRLLTYLRHSGWQADDQPLKPGAPGRPRPADFWVTLVGSAAIVGFVVFAAVQAAEGH